MRILVVDDEMPIREWFQYAIEKIGDPDIEVLSASMGNEAYDIIASQKVDVLFTDIRMPGLDGIELMRKIRNELGDTNLVVILLTNHAEFDYARKAVTLGAHAYLLKSEVTTEMIRDEIEAIRRILPDPEPAEEETDELVDSAYINRAVEYIRENYMNALSLTKVAEEVHLSPEYLSRLFKKQKNENFNHYVTKVRLNAARELIEHTDLPIVEIAEQVGFENQSYFSSQYRKEFQCSPLSDRKLKKQ